MCGFGDGDGDGDRLVLGVRVDRGKRDTGGGGEVYDYMGDFIVVGDGMEAWIV